MPRNMHDDENQTVNIFLEELNYGFNLYRSCNCYNHLRHFLLLARPSVYSSVFVQFLTNNPQIFDNILKQYSS